MTNKIFTVLFYLLSFSAEAQISETIRVKAGDDLSAAVSAHGVYKFPGFIYGTVLFRDGTHTMAKMNFNVFLNDMMFIDNKGDTLAIDHAELIDSIKLDTTIFYYEKGYFQVIADYQTAKLVRQEKINYENVKKGAYGLPAPGASIETYGTSGIQYNPAKTLVLNEDVIIKKETLYLVCYKRFRSVRANERGFLTAFPEIKKEIVDFISINKINFNKETDLEHLLEFCTTHL